MSAAFQGRKQPPGAGGGGETDHHSITTTTTTTTTTPAVSNKKQIVEILEGILRPESLATDLMLHCFVREAVQSRGDDGGAIFDDEIPAEALLKRAAAAVDSRALTPQLVCELLSNSVFVTVDLARLALIPRTLAQRVIRQCELFLDPSSSTNEHFLRCRMTPDGFVPVDALLAHKRIQALVSRDTTSEALGFVLKGAPNLTVTRSSDPSAYWMVKWSDSSSNGVNIVFSPPPLPPSSSSPSTPSCSTCSTPFCSPTKPRTFTQHRPRQTPTSSSPSAALSTAPLALTSHGVRNPNEFKVMTYNILAQFMTHYHDYCLPNLRTWGYRSGLLRRAIKSIGPDIVMLQELQSTLEDGETGDLAGDMRRWMQQNGYEMEYGRKVAHNGYQKAKAQLGVAVCWNTSVFQQEEMATRVCFATELVGECSTEESFQHFSMQSHVCLLVPLIHLPTSTRILFATTHLVADPGAPEIKFAQATVLMKSIAELCCSYDENGEQQQHCPVVLGGDFNTLPDSVVYNYLTHDSAPLDSPELALDDLSRSQIIMPIILPTEDGLISNPVPLLSAYHEVTGEEPEFTTVKPDFEGTLDYIFYSSSDLECVEVLPIPSHESVVLENGGIPNSKHPSDHVPIAAVFSLPDVSQSTTTPTAAATATQQADDAPVGWDDTEGEQEIAF